MPYLRVDEGGIYYQRVGRGPPLVFVNDWVLSHGYWHSAVARLGRHFSCITYDPRGVGRSTSFPSTTSFHVDRHVDDLHRLIVALRSGDVHVVGHGVGALIAGLCLRQHPQDVRTLSLIAPHTGSGKDEAREAYVKSVQTLIILRRVATWPLIRHIVLRRYGLGRLSLQQRQKLLTDFARLNPRAGWETIATALDGATSEECLIGLCRSRIPILFLACGQDPLTSVESIQRWFAQIHRGRLVTMRRTGHFPMLEAEEKFVEILRDFLAAASR